MTSYAINLEGDILRIGFGEPAQNDRIVCDAHARLEELIQTGRIKGGELLKINGPASLPVAFVLAHRLGHLFGAIAIYDPKLGTSQQDMYVVAITHHSSYPIGALISG